MLTHMKRIIKKLLPHWLLLEYRNRKVARTRKLQQLEAGKVFTEIYQTNHWKSTESISGAGSEIKQTEVLIKELSLHLKELNIQSVLDIPCGDFNWMKHVDLEEIDYIGADIVEALINSNKEKYKERENLNFRILDLINDPLPKCDMIIVRDCLVHLSYEEISRAIRNIKSSGSKYLLTTTFPEHHRNKDIVTGKWRPLNMQDKPFSYPAPILVINENCTEDGGKYSDKSMALWNIGQL